MSDVQWYMANVPGYGDCAFYGHYADDLKVWQAGRLTKLIWTPNGCLTAKVDEQLNIPPEAVRAWPAPLRIREACERTWSAIILGGNGNRPHA